MPNERALLSLFFQKMQQEDPDVLVAHNLMGFDFDILLSRAVALKLATWSKVRWFHVQAWDGGGGGRRGGTTVTRESSFNACIGVFYSRS